MADNRSALDHYNDIVQRREAWTQLHDDDQPYDVDTDALSCFGVSFQDLTVQARALTQQQQLDATGAALCAHAQQAAAQSHFVSTLCIVHLKIVRNS